MRTVTVSLAAIVMLSGSGCAKQKPLPIVEVGAPEIKALATVGRRRQRGEVRFDGDTARHASLGKGIHAMTRRQLLIAFAAFTLLLAPALVRADALAIGQPAPMRDTPLKSVKGATITIAKAAGPKGTLVVFSCNHCPWVKMWQTRIAKIGNEAAKQGIGVLVINSNDPSAYPEDSFAETKALGCSIKLREKSST